MARSSLAEQPRHHWRESPFGCRVRVTDRRLPKDPPIGALGQVLTEAEHGIVNHKGYSTLTPNFPGVRGFHYLVRMDGEEKPRVLDRFTIAPA